ncbi:MAG: anhydro-N-acetylmuramic acid kinase [Flavobacteriaceae bacterium]
MHDDYVFSIGLMSGTSLDGLDVVYVKFRKNDYKEFKILTSKTYVYSNDWIEKLRNAIFYSEDKLKALNLNYGRFLGEKVNRFIKEENIKRIDFVASHGHTVFHQPEKGITLQIGDGQTLANIVKLKVVCDFRSQDVELGGQGAPLVPVGDDILFSEFDACLNLGGFANISFVKNNDRLAFDICPVNIVLNHYANRIGFKYDDSGKIALTGKLNNQLLGELNKLEFYYLDPPKSLGLEWVSKYIFPLIDKYNLSVKDILRTYVEHIAIQIGRIAKHISTILITGGGAFNSYLMHRISNHSKSECVIPSDDIINFKEALIFSFLGLLKLDGKINCLRSVTGAKKNHSSGLIFNPNNS